MHVQSIIATHPHARGQAPSALVRCVELCFDCTQACIACADSCLAEQKVDELRRCIRLDLDCADICATTGALASRRTESDESILRAMLQSCAEMCRLCEEECRRHGKRFEHCRICADVCKECESACRSAMTAAH